MSEINEKIISLAQIISPLARTNVFQNIADLRTHLLEHPDELKIAAFVVEDKTDLLEIESIHPMLLTVPFILILSNADESMTTSGFALTPRFLTYADRDLGEVRAVLVQMIENHKKKKLNEEWHRPRQA
jgi:hypothetical protein